MQADLPRWSRSSNSDNANNSRNVNSTGANDNNNANNGNFCAPDFINESLNKNGRGLVSSSAENSFQETTNKRSLHPAPNGQTQTTLSNKEKVCAYTSLLESENRCHKRVGYKNSVSRFHMHKMTKCYELHKDLIGNKYRTGLGDPVIITSPKRRVATTTHYKDRIPQSSFILNWWYPTIIPTLVENNFACIKNRGVDRARETFKTYLREAPYDSFCLSADFKNYFGSIVHNLLIDSLPTDDTWTIQYFSDVINCNHVDIGIGLGSEINQLSATFFPNSLDHSLVRFRYVRYMDDFRIIGTKAECEEALREIEEWAKKKHLAISLKKTRIQRISKPIAFLGFTFMKHESGKVTLKRTKDRIRDEKRKLRRMKKKNIPLERVKQHYASVRETMSKGSRAGVVQLDRYFNNLFA